MYFRYRVALVLLGIAIAVILLGKSGKSVRCDRVSNQVNCQIREFSFGGLQEQIANVENVQKAAIETLEETRKVQEKIQTTGNLSHTTFLKTNSDSVYLISEVEPKGVELVEPTIATQINRFIQSSQSSLQLTLEEKNPGIVLAILIAAFSLVGKNGRGLVIGWKK